MLNKDGRLDLPAMKTYYSNKIIWFGNREKEIEENESTQKQTHRYAESLFLNKAGIAILEERRTFLHITVRHLDIIYGEKIE